MIVTACHMTLPDLLVHPLQGQCLGLQCAPLSVCTVQLGAQLGYLVRKFREGLLKLLYLIRCEDRDGEKADITMCVHT